jgi:RNA polymerase sigma factor (sigma-70 family)
MNIDVAAIYKNLRAKMIVYLERRGCTDPEGVADEALYRAFVHPGVSGRHVESLEAYAFGCLKNVYLEWRRAAQRLAPIDERKTEETSSPPQESVLDIRRALDALPAKDRELLLQYYGDEETAADLAPRFGLTAAGIRTRVHNLKKLIRQMLARSRPSGDSDNTPGPSRDISEWRRQTRSCH